MKKTLILGLGSSIRGDDGAGLYAADKLRVELTAPSVDILATEETGFRLLDILQDYQRLIVIDAIEGYSSSRNSVLRFAAEDFLSKSNSASSHHTGIINLIKMGRGLGLCMPTEIIIYGIPIGRHEDGFDQAISSRIKKIIPELFGLIKKEVRYGH